MSSFVASPVPPSGVKRLLLYLPFEPFYSIEGSLRAPARISGTYCSSDSSISVWRDRKKNSLRDIFEWTWSTDIARSMMRVQFQKDSIGCVSNQSLWSVSRTTWKREVGSSFLSCSFTEKRSSLGIRRRHVLSCECNYSLVDIFNRYLSGSRHRSTILWIIHYLRTRLHYYQCPYAISCIAM